jgi:hypothetical protein
MSDNAENIVYLNTQVACVMIELEAMKAENMERQMLGQSMTFVQDDFMNLIAKYDIGCNDVIKRLYQH